MPLQNDTPMEGQYTPHDGMQGKCGPRVLDVQLDDTR